MNTTIPVEIASILLPFAAVFTKPVWGHAQTLLMGAILTTLKRTITSVLVVMGLNQEEHFRALSSRIKPCSLVKFGGKPNFINSHGNGVFTEWTNYHGNR
jgi:hypothetical protein